jgi:hypothetical protein
MTGYLHIIILVLTAVFVGYRSLVAESSPPPSAAAACVQAYGEPPCNDDAER